MTAHNLLCCTSGGFAGWTHIDAANGSLAIYDLSGPDTVVPYSTTPTPTSGAPYAPSEWFLAVQHGVNVSVGCSPTSSQGSPSRNPCALGVNGTLVRRFHVTPASARASAFDTIAAYAEDNGMVAPPAGRTQGLQAWLSPPFTSLRSKLSAAPGGGPDFWRQVFQAPLMKLDALSVGLPYTNYTSKVNRRLGGCASVVREELPVGI